MKMADEFSRRDLRRRHSSHPHENQTMEHSHERSKPRTAPPPLHGTGAPSGPIPGCSALERHLRGGLRRTLGQLRRSGRRPVRRRRHALGRLGGGLAPGAAGVAAFTNEQQLREIRDQCRALAVANEFAINGHENRISYIVGSGHSYRATARPEHPDADRLVREVQAVLDEFLRTNELAQAAAGDRPPPRPRRRSLLAVLPGSRRDHPGPLRRARAGLDASATCRRPGRRLRHPDRRGRRGDRAGLLHRRPMGRRRPRSSTARRTSTPT